MRGCRGFARRGRNGEVENYPMIVQAKNIENAGDLPEVGADTDGAALCVAHDGTLRRMLWATLLAWLQERLNAAILNHAERHASGGADPITPASIGAAAADHTHEGLKGDPGKSSYQHAVDGGYPGTEEQYDALMADVASKEYVQNAVLLGTATAMDKLVKVTVMCASTDVVKTVYVKLTVPPGNHANTANCYCLNYSGTIHGSGTVTIKLEPPTGYAFNAISGTFCPDVVVGESGAKGVLDADGVYTFTVPNATVGESYFFATNYVGYETEKYNYALPTLEVA